MRPMTSSRPNSERSSTDETSVAGHHRSVASHVGLLLISAYKVAFSPWFSGTCRFVPGCADYTSEALVRHGFARGIWLGFRRLCRCHPFGGHGYDPVPHDRPVTR